VAELDRPYVFRYVEDSADTVAQLLGKPAPVRPVVTVRLSDPPETTYRVVALVDSGSERTFAAPGLARALRLDLSSVPEVVIGLGGAPRSVRFVEVTIELFINGRQVIRHFDRKIDAETWLAEQNLGKRRGSATDSREAQFTVEVYGRLYLERHRVNLAENTVELYEHLFSKHIVPEMGATAVGVSPLLRWRSGFRELKASAASTAAKAYRLLRQIMNTAIEDRLRRDNPCRIKDGRREPESDRPSVSVSEVAALAEAMPANLPLAVLLACWTSLRRAEILGLRRRDVDVGLGTVTIRHTKVITVKNAENRRAADVTGRSTAAIRGSMVVIFGEGFSSP